MKKCIKCGSHAFNLYMENIDQGDLCDVHYWQDRANRAEAQPAQEPDELTIAYMSGLYDGKKKRPLVGLTDDKLADLWYKESLDWMEFARAHEDALRSKNA